MEFTLIFPKKQGMDTGAFFSVEYELSELEVKRTYIPHYLITACKLFFQSRKATGMCLNFNFYTFSDENVFFFIFSADIKFFKKLENQKGKEKGTLQLDCKASNPNNAPVKWLQNGKPISKDDP